MAIVGRTSIIKLQRLKQLGRISIARANKEIRRLRMIESRKKGTHTKEQWESMKVEFGMRCVKCWEIFPHLDKDHIIPVYQGGSDSIENIQPLCAWCNCSKSSETFNWKEFRRGEMRLGKNKNHQA